MTVRIKPGDGMPTIGTVEKHQSQTDYGYITTRVSMEIRDVVNKTADGIILECVIEKEFMDSHRKNLHSGRIVLNLDQSKQFSQLLLDGIRQIEENQKVYEEYLKEEAAKKIT